MPKQRRRRKNQRTRSAAKPIASERGGADYGSLPHVMGIGSMGFASHLHAADIVGVAYGEDRSTEFGAVVPSVSLVARNGAALRLAFNEFSAWVEATDGDAVELTFVLRKDGSYLLALGPEPSRLERRCLGFSRTSRVNCLTPGSTMSRAFKRIETPEDVTGTALFRPAPTATS